MEKRYVIIASDSNLTTKRLWAYGTRTNRPFDSERSAKQRKTQMERMTRGLSFVVVPLMGIMAGSMLKEDAA